MEKRIPIIIPAYEPDERFLVILQKIADEKMGPVIVVNDGSGSEYDGIFEKVGQLIQGEGGILLVHDKNRGKGRALKTAFSYVLEHDADALGVVTADSDGQHSVPCIKAVMDALRKEPDSLILGVRDFEKEGIPWKSRFGNRLTKRVLAYISGLKLSDTQTGLRGIPREFMGELLEVKGERFEFEMRMLLETEGKVTIREIPIETVYESETNHQTHFNPLKDSVKIYRVLGERFLKFILSSFSSGMIDLLFFTIFCQLLKTWDETLYVAAATALARVISSLYNFTINQRVVFKSKEKTAGAAGKYFLLAILQMGASAALTTLGAKALPVIPEVAVKIVVDTFLFFVSYYLQRKFVFGKK